MTGEAGGCLYRFALGGMARAVRADQEQPLVTIEIAEQRMLEEMMAKIFIGRFREVARAPASCLESLSQFFGGPA